MARWAAQSQYFLCCVETGEEMKKRDRFGPSALAQIQIEREREREREISLIAITYL
jgi:hypothetical protein